jgi:hypothetical protein
MLESILFNPDNRQLGNSAGDLSLYGGQSEAAFSIPQAPDPPPEMDGGAIVQSVSPSPGPANGTIGAPTGPADSGADDRPETAPATSFLTSPVTAMPQPLPPDLSEGISPVQSAWSPAAPGAGAPSSFLQQGGAQSGDAPLGITQVASPAGSVAEAAEPAFHTVSDLLEAPAIAAPLLSTVGDVATVTVGAVTDTLEDLAGTDPLGGVATLVSLISVSDMFDLHPVDAPMPDAPADLGFGMLDMLAGDLLPDPLLGGAPDHDGALGLDHVLDHPLGL